MSFAVKGWCPGAHRPMMSGDGLVVRVRPVLGRLSAAQTRGIAQAAIEFGNGLIDLTSRANLQIRGVQETALEPLLAALGAMSLLDPDAASETRRNIVVQPLWMDGDDTHQIAQSLTDALRASDLTLPSKFGFAVDCGDAPALRDASADIRLERGQTGLICRADGTQMGVAVTHDTAAQTALEMAAWFLDSGGAPDGRGRMARHLCNAPLPARFARVPWGATGRNLPPAGATPLGVLVAAEFGQIPAETLAALGSVGALRLSPRRGALIEGASKLPALDGIITDPNDPRLTIDTCPGGPFCPQASVSTRDLARKLAPYLNDALHLSGCAKGCARQTPAPFCLTGENGRYTLAFNARAGESPLHTTMTEAQILAHFGAA